MDQEVLELNELSRKLFISDIDSAITKAKKTVELSRKRNLKAELAESLITLSYVLSEQGNFLDIIKYIFEAISILKFENNKELQVSAYSQLGSIYLINGDLDRSFSAYMTSLNITRSLGREADNPATLLGLGTILSYKETYDDSIKYYNRALNMACKQNNNVIKLKAKNNLGYIYNVLGELDKAEELLLECITGCKETDLYNIMVPALDELGIIYRKRGDNISAVSTWEKATDIDKSRGLTYVSIAPLINLAHYYVDTESWDEAEECLTRASDICNETNSKIDLLEIYQVETEFSEKRGDFKRALEYHKKYFEINKEIRSMENVITLKEAELESLTNSKNRIIALSRVGQVITESLNLKKMLTRMYDNLDQLFDFSILGLARFDAKENSITYEMFIEDGKTIPNFTTSVDDKKSIGAWCIRNNKRIVISNYEKEKGDYVEGHCLQPAIKTNGRIPKSAICNPLRINDKIIGLITIQSNKESAYSPEDIDVFEVLSTYAAIGLNNALQSAKIEEQNKKLSILAAYDGLTGLKNRRSFFSAANKCWSWSVRTKTPISLILLDLDFFKNINDSFGHPAGDYCLIEIGKILTKSIKRDSDEVGRFGGEEFVLFLGHTDENGAYAVAEAIRKTIEEFNFTFKNKKLPVTASLGVVTVEPHLIKDKNIDDIFSEADKALYQAKDSGRNCVKIYHS